MLTEQDARGAIMGYYILYKRKREPEASWKNGTVDRAETTSLVLASLDEYTSYQFAIQAFNRKGVSGRSEIVERMTDGGGQLLKQTSSCLVDFYRQSSQDILSYGVKKKIYNRHAPILLLTLEEQLRKYHIMTVLCIFCRFLFYLLI